MTQIPEACPLCTAMPGQCDHEILRWSQYAAEFEDSPLELDAIALAVAIARLVRHNVAARRALPDFLPVGKLELELFAEPDDDPDAYSSPVGGIDAALALIAQIPDVLVTEDVLGINQPATSYWAQSAAPVRDRIFEWIRRCEIEMAREDTGSAAELDPQSVTLRAIATEALGKYLLAGVNVVGPYRLDDPSAPRINVHLRLPRKHVVFFLAMPVSPRGLESSTVILVDDRIPSVVEITSANDEG